MLDIWAHELNNNEASSLVIFPVVYSTFQTYLRNPKLLPLPTEPPKPLLSSAVSQPCDDTLPLVLIMALEILDNTQKERSAHAKPGGHTRGLSWTNTQEETSVHANCGGNIP
ncbi:hypothetical protein PsorP6_014721 [Peronosclerospora sorghi]|uniref:Uncharacterized protein n=1 Tax=Peronosclerospora sorghi TaxID=230839 RepID=A0ACC0VR61_9STRA|nr:hypothetical protein PsorP6_014721 [Peronosclerospora sorghi]